MKRSGVTTNLPRTTTTTLLGLGSLLGLLGYKVLVVLVLDLEHSLVLASHKTTYISWLAFTTTKLLIVQCVRISHQDVPQTTTTVYDFDKHIFSPPISNFLTKRAQSSTDTKLLLSYALTRLDFPHAWCFYYINRSTTLHWLHPVHQSTCFYQYPCRACCAIDSAGNSQNLIQQHQIDIQNE